MNKCWAIFGAIFVALMGERLAAAPELVKLKNMQGAVVLYMNEHGGNLPRDLHELRDYVDLPRLLGPDTDPYGPFTTRYAFLPSMPWIDTQGGGGRQLLLLGLKPFKSGERGAIWRYSDGDYSSGMINERHLQTGGGGFDFTNLTPMGGGIPAPTHPYPDAPISEYQAKVLKLAREAKITPQPRTPEGNAPTGGSEPSSVPAGTSVRTWVLGILALIVVVVLALKRRA